MTHEIIIIIMPFNHIHKFCLLLRDPPLPSASRLGLTPMMPSPCTAARPIEPAIFFPLPGTDERGFEALNGAIVGAHLA